MSKEYVEGLERELGYYLARGENERAAEVRKELARLGAKETAVTEAAPERAVEPKAKRR